MFKFNNLTFLFIVTFVSSLLISNDKKKMEQEFFDAIEDANIMKIDRLLLDGVNVNAKGPFGQTPIIVAARNRNKSLVRLLIQAHANVNAKDRMGMTPLIFAAGAGDLDIVKLLIKSGADINARNNLGVTPLIWASKFDKKEVVELLLKAGAKINLKENRGLDALDNARKKKNQEIIDIICAAQIKRQKNNEYKQELFEAIRSGNISQVKELIKKVTLNIQDNHGNNPLHYAMKTGNLEIVNLIYSINPGLISKVNKDNETPLSYIGANAEFIEGFKKLYFENIISDNNN